MYTCKMIRSDEHILLSDSWCKLNLLVSHFGSRYAKMVNTCENWPTIELFRFHIANRWMKNPLFIVRKSPAYNVGVKKSFQWAIQFFYLQLNKIIFSMTLNKLKLNDILFKYLYSYCQEVSSEKKFYCHSLSKFL